MLIDRVKELLERRPIPGDEIVLQMGVAARAADPKDLDGILYVVSLDALGDEVISHPAVALLPAWGAEGVAALERLVLEGPRRAAALGVLAETAAGAVPEEGDLPFLRSEWAKARGYTLRPDTQALAFQRFRSLLISGLTDFEHSHTILGAIHLQSVTTNEAAAQRRLAFIFGLVVDSYLLINPSLLDTFRALLDAGPEKEEDLHRFLVAHPALLDPLAVEVRTKHELGSDFITDFVLRRANDSYVVVEIENSTDRIFTAKGTLSSEVLEAEGQVRDFQAWIHQNIAYAQKKLPNIHRPEGLIVIGRRATLDPVAARRLEEENFMRRSLMRIVTYDDLLDQAATIYTNMLSRPPVFTTKDQRVI